MNLRTALIALGLVVPVIAVEPIADFSLPDVNPTSPRFEQMVSPRDYLHQVTAYYFGAST